MKRTGKQVKQWFLSCFKVVAALSPARDWFKSLRSGLILFLHLGTVQGFSIIDKLVIRWELGLFLCLIPLGSPSPLAGVSSKLCLIFFYWTAPTECPRTLCPWEKNNFSVWYFDWLFFPLLSLLFCCFSVTVVLVFLFPRSLFVFMPKLFGWGSGFNFSSDGHFDKTQSMFLITWIFLCCCHLPESTAVVLMFLLCSHLNACSPQEVQPLLSPPTSLPPSLQCSPFLVFHYA